MIGYSVYRGYHRGDSVYRGDHRSDSVYSVYRGYYRVYIAAAEEKSSPMRCTSDDDVVMV